MNYLSLKSYVIYYIYWQEDEYPDAQKLYIFYTFLHSFYNLITYVSEKYLRYIILSLLLKWSESLRVCII